uniref:Uncharacterized protein n=1 Tax=Entomoneis paludosa TaxID=265537 RepID=A0A7S2Y895_9STRA
MLAQLSTCLLTPTPIGGSQKPLNDRMTVYCATDPSEEEDSKLDPRQVEFYTRPFQWECSSVEDCQQEPENSSSSSSSEVSSEEYNVIAVTALFNLGLCYHWQWQQAQQQQQQAPPKLAAGHNSSSCTLEHLLQQALYAYEQAFLLTTAYDCPPALLPVLLGVCANATHVHIELAQSRTAALWNQRLTSTLRLYLSQSPSPVDPAARKFFSLQAFFQSFPRHAASAA